MKPAAEDLLAFCRMFGMTERSAVCGDVSVAQCVTLQLLAREAKDSSSLATETGVTKGAITRLVDGLQTRGWVDKQPDAEDGRRSLLLLTKSGARKAAELERITEAAIDALLAEVPEDKRTQVVESLRLLRIAAEAARHQLGCC